MLILYARTPNSIYKAPTECIVIIKSYSLGILMFDSFFSLRIIVKNGLYWPLFAPHTNTPAFAAIWLCSVFKCEKKNKNIQIVHKVIKTLDSIVGFFFLYCAIRRDCLIVDLFRRNVTIQALARWYKHCVLRFFDVRLKIWDLRRPSLQNRCD